MQISAEVEDNSIELVLPLYHYNHFVYIACVQIFVVDRYPSGHLCEKARTDQSNVIK